jgi:Fe-Mn family superoxide dismutase
MSIKLPDLPYEKTALAPAVSERTLDFHYGKHHRGYVDKLNKAIIDTPYESLNIEQIITRAAADGNKAVFNNAAQVWNHTFLWHSFSPDGGGSPKGVLGDALEQSFGGLDKFRRQFADAATGHFGSGWAWLVADGNKLNITTTADADTPIAHGAQPLLTLDLWEHAYYLDYQNDRAGYVDAFLNELINWSFAASNFADARAAA